MLPFRLGYPEYWPSASKTGNRAMQTCCKHPTDRRIELLGLVRKGNCAKLVAARCRAHVLYSAAPLGKSKVCGGSGGDMEGGWKKWSNASMRQ